MIRAKMQCSSRNAACRFRSGVPQNDAELE